MSYYEKALKVKPILDLGRAANEMGITMEAKPVDLPSRPGYKWAPQQLVAGGSITWFEEEDPDAQGTSDNPIAWEAGITVAPNYWYTYGDTLYVCVKAGNPTDITDTNYFEPM